MSTQNKKETATEEHSHADEEAGHVHGPHCNHHHHEALKPMTRATPKIGRNDPCICNSGKKYKKCCGQ